MDFGNLVFNEPEGADQALPAPDFDFYGAFLQPPNDVLSGDMSLAPQHHQETPRDQTVRRHHVGSADEFDVDEDMAYLAEEDSSTSGSMLAVCSVTTAAATTASPIVIGSSRSPYAHPQNQYHLASPTPALLHSGSATGQTLSNSKSLSPLPSNATTESSRTKSSSSADPLFLRPKVVPASLTATTLSSTGTAPNDSLVPTSSSGNRDSNSNNKRLERRGHTKSRRGCFNCKRRRIKCQETRPACGHCLKTGLQCEYPVAPLVNHQPQHQIPLFSLQDMRFFQHFLLHCSPHQPLGNKSLWTHEIPCLSHSYDYLMHALLGMAASDLMQQDASLVTAAMDHRLKAIRAIKRTLAAVSKWPNVGQQQQHCSQVDDHSNSCSASPPASGSGEENTRPGSGSGEKSWDMNGGSSAPGTPMFEEGNALMATCFALTFQSVALDDGMAEYMTFIRGIVVVAIQMYLKGARIMFRNLLNNEQTELLRPAIEPMSGIDRQWSEAALAAVQNLAPLCEGDSVATTYHALVIEMAEALLVSPMEAYSAMTRHYAWWMQLPHEQFRQVIDLDRQVFVLLATHWIALKQIMTRITSKEEQVSAVSSSAMDCDGSVSEVSSFKSKDAGHGDDAGMDPGIIRWLKHLNRQVEPEYLVYNKWPIWVEAELDRDRTVFIREKE